MSQLNYTTENKKGQHLNYEERQKMEVLLKAGLKNSEIARILGNRSERTIRREKSLGMVELLNSDYTTRLEYSADVAQKYHDERSKNKGPRLKIGSNFKLVKFIEDKIGNEKFSPYAALEKAKTEEGIEVNICFKTLYNYIDAGLFLHITNKDLPVKKRPQKRNYQKVRKAYTHKGTSIAERPKEIENRAEFGHWELDTVVGKQGTKAVLMVLTERALNVEIVRKIESKSELCIVSEINKLERHLGSGKFKEVFKTITCDNGCENLDYEGIEQSVITKGKRTKVYYAHPYSSYERGSNECANKLIRRFIPKGTDISQFSKKQIRYIQNWINNYPRRIFGGLSSVNLMNILGLTL